MSVIKTISGGKESLTSVRLDDISCTLTNKQRHELQQALFEMYQDILSLSKELGVTPFLVGGSALGAVRHNGFIPWDDDLDLGMMRKEYDLFLESFKAKMSGKYIVNTPKDAQKSKARFAKIIKKNTVFKEIISVPDEELNGIFIDIFPIENVPDNPFFRFIKGLASNITAYISSQVFNRENQSPESIIAFKRVGKMNYFIRTIVGAFFGFYKSSRWFHVFDRISQSNETTSKFCSIPAGRKHFFGEILDRKSIFPAKHIDFMGTPVPVFQDVDSYLRHLYGDYMSIPPEEKREKHFVSKFSL